MNRTINKCCAWSGVVMLVLMGIGFMVLAGFVPPPSPQLSADEIAGRIIDNRDAIRWGMIVMMVAASVLELYYVAITLQMWRIEGKYPTLALIQFGLNTLAVIEFLYIVFFWQTATFRADRPAELILLLNDMAWVPFIGLTSTLVLGTVAFGVAILLDRRAVPVFPRWLGYYNLWCALMFIPGSFDVFFKSGPLAWNGIISFYVVIGVFASSLFVNGYFLSKAVDSAIAEDRDAAESGGQVQQVPASPEFARLRADVDQLLARSTT